MPDLKTKLGFTEYPYMLWIFGAGLMILGIYLYKLPGDLLWSISFLALGAALAFVFSNTTTVVADKTRLSLTIQRKGLLKNQAQEFSKSEIETFEVDTSHGYISGRSGRAVYRLVMVKKTGEKIPLENVFSADEKGREEKARLLREFLGVTVSETKYSNFYKTPVEDAHDQEMKNVESGITSGVNWQMETISTQNGKVTRWISPDAYLLGNFLFLAQKPKSSPSIFSSGGLLGSLWQMIYQKIMSLYGFQPEDTPGIESAKTMESVDERLELYFAALTSDPGMAKKVINSWLINPLTRWAERHPIHTLQKLGEGQSGQLVILFAPEKLYVVVFESADMGLRGEIISLGVDLVKARGNQP
jgi:hypothetical protein